MTNFFFATFLLTVQVFSLNWQSHGNFSSLQLTQINSLVTNQKTLIAAGKTYTLAAQDISAALNTKFDNAWNVFVIKMNKNWFTSDGIVDGYAFRQHWFWYNDYPLGLIFIIWKDYNCNPIDFYTFNFGQMRSFQQSGIYNNMYNYLNDLFNNPLNVGNPWLMADKAIKKAQQLVPNSAWTAVAIGTYIDNFNNYGARFCSLHKENYLLQCTTLLDQFYAMQIHLLRMR